MKKIVVFSVLTIAVLTSQAQDRYFGRTYTTAILPKGAIDVEFWHTSRFGHKNQFFHAQDQRMEVEIGLGKNIQTAFYFNRFQQRFSSSLDGTETSNEIGFSNEWKWKVSGPSKKWGIALYEEWDIKGGDELEFESKIILDRSFGKSLFAFNGVVEYEKEFEWKNGKLDSGNWELPVEFDLAYMYNMSTDLGLGFEILNQNGIVKGNGWKYSVFFGGPTINFRGNNWFVIANYMPQWGNVHKTNVAPFGKVLDEHERTEARILFGISLK